MILLVKSVWTTAWKNAGAGPRETGAINRAPTSLPDKSGNWREPLTRFSSDDEYTVFDRIYFTGISSGNLLPENVGARFIAPASVGQTRTLAKNAVVRTKLASRVIYCAR